MTYPRFLLYNVLGALLWVVSLTLAGYWFGGLAWVKVNFEIVVLAIIVISLVPMAVEFINARRRIKREAAAHGASGVVSTGGES
jgi:membrane-associated protein